MNRVLLFAFLVLSALAVSAKPLHRLDALPAFDPLHVSGPYAGRHGCPMCTHGYDAGVMVFLPGDIAPAVARAWREALGVEQLAVDSPRFRIFVILTDRAPSEATLAALQSNDSRWHVATLAGQALTDTEAAYFTDLSKAPRGYVFAQRRIVREFDGAILTAGAKPLATDAREAMALLAALYPVAVTDGEQPQGELWLAPPRLFSEFAREGYALESHCLGEPPRLADALVHLQGPAGANDAHWARTDEKGCMRLGLPAGTYHVRVYPRTGESFTRELVLGANSAQEIIVGGPCEGCELVFAGRPMLPDSVARIAPREEPGEALRIEGQVRDARGRPAPGIEIYAYHTDRAGHYPRDAHGEHGRLRGWALTDEQGHYAFDTIRPGAYPGRGVPAHVHVHVIEPGRCTYVIPDLWFADDPLLTSASRRTATAITVEPRRHGAAWRVTRDMALGQGIADYARCARIASTGT